MGRVTPSCAQQPSSYSKDVRAFLARYCLECHNAASSKGNLNLESFSDIMHGGEHGAVVYPGKPDESRLVLLPEHKAKPAMPPKKAKQPKPMEVAVLRNWVAAGARHDSERAAISIPDIKPHSSAKPAIAALAYRPDGKLLAVGRHKQIILVDPSTSAVVFALAELAGRVSGLSFAPDGGHLAVSFGSPGLRGQVQLYSLKEDKLSVKPVRIFAGHKDVVLDMVFSPNGKIIATAGYDRVIKLWEVDSGKELHSLKDHSDAVYGLAFSPDSRLLASASADRTVKVWNVASAARLYTLGEATDWLYAVAWSPDGRHLAAGGIDRSIRIWQVTPQSGKLMQSAFAHEAAVTRVIYAPDGKTLYSLGEDRVIKHWNTANMTERHVYETQPETVLALALHPDGKQIALGRFDGSLQLLNAATGKRQSEPLPEKPKPPRLAKVTPEYGQRGTTIRLELGGSNLGSVRDVVTNVPHAKIGISGRASSGDLVRVDFTLPLDAPAGLYSVGIKAATGEAASLPFMIDLFPLRRGDEHTDSPDSPIRIVLPASVSGTLDRAGRVNYYDFEAVAGQQVGVQLVPFSAAKAETDLFLSSEDGHVVAQSTTSLLGHTCERAGRYILSVRDRDYGGSPERKYRLHVGPIPIVTRVFPTGVPRGTETEIDLEGVNLGRTRSVRMKTPADVAVGTNLGVPLNGLGQTALGKLAVVVGEFAEVTAREPSASRPLLIPVPGTANGRIAVPGQTDRWRFFAKKGTRLVVEVQARRLGSPLDSFIEVLDRQGQPVPRAVLRAVARTYVTFRDHDSNNPNIRLENWSELAINDYLWTGNELIRIHELPKNPDDDCRFFSVQGQRIGFLDTTPLSLSLGTPLYKVTIHPPGTSFPANGFPLVRLNYRNDDGGPDHGKDSRLFFEPPADDEYQVQIGDSAGRGGAAFSYRLTVRPPRPDFSVTFTPTAPAVARGGAAAVTVSAVRTDDFKGPIDVHLENLPAGFSAPSTTIPAEENSTTFALAAHPSTKAASHFTPLKLVARALIDGVEIRRDFIGQIPQVIEPGDIVTTTEQAEVTVRPGSEVHIHAKIERRNGFKGRVPLEVRGLPHGVRVLDIGLNGILITEKDNHRTFAIYAEPWVKPQTHPFVVLAKHEGKGTEHAAKSVVLNIEK